MKTITKTDENIAVIYEENVRNQNPKPLLTVKIRGYVMTPELLKLVTHIFKRKRLLNMHAFCDAMLFRRASSSRVSKNRYACISRGHAVSTPVLNHLLPQL
jgi:hypothetical protein